MLQSAGVLSLAAALPSIGNAQSNLRGVTLRAASYKGGHKTLLEAAGLAQTPYGRRSRPGTGSFRTRA